MTRAPLDGNKLVRLAFLDEAGRSRLEPDIVVGGILINGDRTYRALVAEFDQILTRHIPEPDRKGFAFHAKDLFHGGGKYFKDRQSEWPRERRWPILEELAGLPRKFGIPVVFGHLNKAEYAAQRSGWRSDLEIPERHRADVVDVAEHMVAFGHAEICIERQMRLFPRDEICMVIAEDTDRVRHALKIAHAFLRDPQEMADNPFLGEPGLPLVKIEDTPHFASKTESRPLQLADTCAFLIMRRVARKENTQAFFEAIAPQLVWRANAFGDQMGAESFLTGPRY
jgi:hypothetical protein